MARVPASGERSALAIRHVAFEDLGLLDPLLRERGYSIDYLDAGLDRIDAASVARADLLIVLGGPIGVYQTEAYPFLRDEIDAIRARAATRAPLLGVCLGAQLIARALDAEVRATGAKEIGYAPLELTDEGAQSVLAPLSGVRVLHWHGDEFDIPEGAESLAHTPGFPNQAFSIGDWALGLQFHLEAEHARIEQWLIGHSLELSHAGLDPARIRSDAAAYGPDLARSASDVLGAWLDRQGAPHPG